MEHAERPIAEVGKPVWQVLLKMKMTDNNMLCPGQRNFIEVDSEAIKKFPASVGSLHLTSSFALLHELGHSENSWNISQMNYKLQGPGLLLKDIATRQTYQPIFNLQEEADESDCDPECPEELDAEQMAGFCMDQSMFFFD